MSLDTITTPETAAPPGEPPPAGAPAEMLVSARGLARSFGTKRALQPLDFDIPAGRIVGVIGANGAGKSTLLNCLLGLIPHEGTLAVMGHDPATHRSAVMRDVCFIADVATLPRWARIGELLDWMEGLHPRFDRRRAEARINAAHLPRDRRIRTFSKGMVVQLHLALVLSIDARLLVLDEPTLGLDIVNRRGFYDAIIQEYFDPGRSVIVTTHQVDEIEPILTHVMFIRDGQLMLDASMDDIARRFVAVDIPDARRAEANALRLIYTRTVLGRTVGVFRDVPPERLETFGEPRRVGLADLFVALAQPDGAAAA
jgi:ABC-2 type transport system ATP-binding protein